MPRIVGKPQETRRKGTMTLWFSEETRLGSQLIPDVLQPLRWRYEVKAAFRDYYDG
jgi:hypothetical protein